MRPLITVIMSTYNESVLELKRSIDSILNQTYTNIEFVIIDDNPLNNEIGLYLKSIDNKKVRILFNDKNYGLVFSLNRALNTANGTFIARMDADDESLPTRIENQYFFLTENNYDLIGGNIHVMDEKGNLTGESIKFPQRHKDIAQFSRFISCIAHPTWFGRKNVFEKLNGYRNILFCEDYDFILRALYSNIKIGNMPSYCLNYRVRSNSITRQHLAEQKIRSRYLANLGREIIAVDEFDIQKYFESDKYYREKENYLLYALLKEKIKNYKLDALIKILFNKNLYLAIGNKIIEKIIEVKM